VKRKKITYWIATGWLALGMTSTGIVQLMKEPGEVKPILEMGYPSYVLTLLGVWKILGSVAVLAPGLPLLKEWAYAGFFFTMTGAIFSHIAVGHGVGEILPASLILVLTVISWLCRPPGRRLSGPSGGAIMPA